MSTAFSGDPLNVYRALRFLNPSPYMVFFDLGDHHVVSASPEILARVESGRITVRPLAGTRKRGANEEEDKALEAELLADDKELAEHLMLIDLSRNDSGRVSKTGSVTVPRKMFVERYSHVMHIASIVESEIRDDCLALDVLKSTLPVGTLSGAPKVRAMEIIDELEPQKRGSMAVPWVIWVGTTIWIWPLRSARQSSRMTCSMCRRGGYRGRLPARIRMGRNAEQGPGNRSGASACPAGSQA